MMNITVKKLSVICICYLLLYSAAGLAIPEKKGLVNIETKFLKSKIEVKKDIYLSMGNGYSRGYKLSKIQERGSLAGDNPSYLPYSTWQNNRGSKDRGGEPANILFYDANGNGHNSGGWSQTFLPKKPMAGEDIARWDVKDAQGENVYYNERNCLGPRDSYSHGGAYVCRIAPPDQECALSGLSQIGGYEQVRLVRGKPDYANYPDEKQGWWFMFRERGKDSNGDADYNCWKRSVVDTY